MLPYKNYNDVLGELQYYILDNENIQKIINDKHKKQNKPQYQVNEVTEIIRCNEIKTTPPEIEKLREPSLLPVPLAVELIETKNYNFQKPKNEFYIPKQQDMLFWCFYIMKNGESNYESMMHKNSLMAKQMKIELILNIRKHKDIIKTYKFDTITNIESNLSNDVVINVKTFLTLCAVENINVVYVSKKTYFELLMNDTPIIYIVKENPSQIENKSNYYNKYGFEIATEENLILIRNTLYKLDNIGKPIKGLTAYKLQDLIHICNKLSIELINSDTGKNKTKNDLYESIIQYF